MDPELRDAADAYRERAATPPEAVPDRTSAIESARRSSSVTIADAVEVLTRAGVPRVSFLQAGKWWNYSGWRRVASGWYLGRVLLSTDQRLWQPLPSNNGLGGGPDDYLNGRWPGGWFIVAPLEVGATDDGVAVLNYTIENESGPSYESEDLDRYIKEALLKVLR